MKIIDGMTALDACLESLLHPYDVRPKSGTYITFCRAIDKAQFLQVQFSEITVIIQLKFIHMGVNIMESHIQPTTVGPMSTFLLPNVYSTYMGHLLDV